RLTLDRAKKLAVSGDFEGAHNLVSTIADGSVARQSQDFREIENKWADDLLTRADHEPDIALKRALYQRVAQAMTVDPGRRKVGADKLQELDVVASAPTTNPMQLPL